MTKTVDVAANEKIASVWGNEIRDRTIQVFASVAERDAQWPTAPNGAHCVTLDTYTVWQRRAGAWVVNAPQAVIGGLTAGDIGNGQAPIIASIASLAAGFWLVSYSVAIASGAPLTGIQLKLFTPAGQWYYYNAPAFVGSGTYGFSVLVNMTTTGALQIALANSSGYTVSTYNDPSTHQLAAVRVLY